MGEYADVIYRASFIESLAELDHLDRTLPHGVDDVWSEGMSELRNDLVWITASYALRLGLTTFVSPEEEWPVVYILLPEGQISWHVPVPDNKYRFAEMITNPDAVWDGHTREEKADRIKRYLENNR